MTKSKLTILILTLLVFGLVISGCALSRQVGKQVSEQEIDQNVGQNVKTLEVVEPEDSPSEELTQDDEIDTSDWKTYRNEEYGFEFKYPEKSERFTGQQLHEIVFQDNRFFVADSAWIEVLQMSNDNPEIYINNVILKDADKNCIVKSFENSDELPAGYLGYFIQVVNSNSEERPITYADEFDCTDYSGRGQPSYFIYSRNVPTKILHLVRLPDPSMSIEQFNKFVKTINFFN